jgi:triosephosphate isomerase
MRRPIIAGNWKMNKNVEEALTFARAIRHELNNIPDVERVLCPPFIALPALAEALHGSHIGLGAQNMHFESSGAFTGEVAASMLVPFCQYVILGHSERRAYFAESDESVNRKVKAALAHGLTPMVCVGESLAQNEAGETHTFVGGQVRAAFAGLTASDAAHCVVAYEPIWAIGTGKSASAAEAGRIIGITVRGALAELFGEDTAQAIRIQYGGSVSPDNIGEYMRQADIDGALVGGASLKPDFVELVRHGADAKR